MLNVIETAKKDTTSGKMINWYVLPVICGLMKGTEPLWIGSLPFPIAIYQVHEVRQKD